MNLASAKSRMETPARQSQRAIWPALAIIAAGLAVGVRFWIAIQTHAVGEDALITLRYAENIAAGNGFVYNIGQRVLGTTTPLYTLLLALFCRMQAVDAMSIGRGMNILADGCTCFLIFRLLANSRIGHPGAGLLGSILYGFSPLAVDVSISGMETGLVTCMGMLAIHAWQMRRAYLLFIAGAILFLLRIDGLALLGILVACLAIRERRIPWRETGIALILVLPWLLFAGLYFHALVPNSVTAKLVVYSNPAMQQMFGMRSNKHREFADLFVHGAIRTGVTVFFAVGTLPIARAASHALMARKTAQRASLPRREYIEMHGIGALAGLMVPVAWLAIYYAAMFASPVLAFRWYFLPPWPIFCAVAGLGAGEAVSAVVDRTGLFSESVKLRLTVAAIVCVLTFSLLRMNALRYSIGAQQYSEDRFRKPVGLWLGVHVEKEERVLIEPIGYAGYYSRRPILDMAGLVSPEVLPSYRNADFIPDIVRRASPQWLCLRPGEARFLQSGNYPDLAQRYDFVTELRSPDTTDSFRVYRRR
jgi:hypothetical protein